MSNTDKRQDKDWELSLGLDTKQVLGNSDWDRCSGIFRSHIAMALRKCIDNSFKKVTVDGIREVMWQLQYNKGQLEI